MLYVLNHTYIPQGEAASKGDYPYKTDCLAVSFSYELVKTKAIHELESLIKGFYDDEAALQDARQTVLEFGLTLQISPFQRICPIVGQEDQEYHGFHHLLFGATHMPILLDSYEIVACADMQAPAVFVEIYRGNLEGVYTNIPGESVLYPVVTGEESCRVDPEYLENQKTLKEQIKLGLVRRIMEPGWEEYKKNDTDTGAE